MDFWPGSSTHTAPTLKKGRPRKEQSTAKATTEGEAYPVVDHGALTSANLRRVGRRLEWSVLTKEETGRKLVAQTDGVKISPATRPQRAPAEQLNITHQAEQGANFLRTHYPDVDIASDLIRDELTADARLAADLELFNPDLGTLLTPVLCGMRSARQSAFLAFPMGQTACELNISPLSYTKRDLTTFKASASPVRTFNTPIQQIISCPPDGNGRTETWMGVRTTGGTHVLEVQPKANQLLGVLAKELSMFTRSHTGDRPLVDLMFHSLPDTTLFAVNDSGWMYKCDLYERHTSMDIVYQHSSEPPQSRFWRLAAMPEPETPLLLSETRLDMLDLRSTNSCLALASVKDAKTVFTSVEGIGVDNMIRLLSTDELVFVDKRFPLRPVFGVTHNRQWDRTLRVQSLKFGKQPLSILTSTRNPLVTVYDVSEGSDGFAHLNMYPYALPHVPKVGRKLVGQTLFRHPNSPEESSAMLLQMNERGAIHRLDLRFTSDGRQAAPFVGRTHDWSQEVLDLERRMEDAVEDGGALGVRTFLEADLEPVYRRIYGLEDTKEIIESPEAVYDILDAMPTFSQNLEAPVEQVLTTFDVAFRSGNEPANPSRADFFTASSINSVRGYRALVQGRIPRDKLAKHAPWHHNWAPSLRPFLPDMSETPQDMQERLSRYDLLADDFRTGPSLRLETEAREQLTLDLALSSDVYAPHPIKQAEPSDFIDDAFETMSRATEAMSIGIPEPPAVRFSFLRPELQDHYDRTKEDEARKMDCPLGVRLLLNEWEIGADPRAYAYRDPYDSAEPLAAPPRAGRSQRMEKGPAAEAKPQPARMPPVIAIAPAAPPPIAASQSVRPRPPAQSQDTGVLQMGSQPTQLHTSLPSFSQSQGMMLPSTQVLPGPFGGRPAPAKKKPAKKRMGGF